MSYLLLVDIISFFQGHKKLNLYESFDLCLKLKNLFFLTDSWNPIYFIKILIMDMVKF